MSRHNGRIGGSISTRQKKTPAVGKLTGVRGLSAKEKQMVRVYGIHGFSSTPGLRAGVAVIVAITLGTSPAQGADQCEIRFNNGHQVVVPAATTAREQAKGLSGVTDPQGMAFVWPESASPAFWMKDTPSPLSVAFIEPDGRISRIQAMNPLSLENHRPPAPVIAALELPTGSFQDAELKPGDYVSQASCFELEGTL